MPNPSWKGRSRARSPTIKGEPLPGVGVELTGTAIMGKRATVTSGKGTFVFLNVPPGKMTLTVSLAGFKTWIQDNLVLGAGSTLEVNPALQVGCHRRADHGPGVQSDRRRQDLDRRLAAGQGASGQAAHQP
ncbi:MAG: carboxypeptidase-like regulatory domain-containing protein [Candidatus Moduliflexus flocculans]|nr:carboxypeptidase-like regulatory domain-containing protein [Candidatus Moduliflexus flocculans]